MALADGRASRRTPREALTKVGSQGACVSLLALCAWLAGASATQDAIANGDTRTISIQHMHTKESVTITFKRDGRYDGSALERLNWLLRDWRRDEAIKMDPRLFDVAWEVKRELGTSEPLHVVSAYRSPQTNSMLRRRSSAVAKHSQHTLGKALDFYLPGVSAARIRAIGVRLQRGGVGYYPHAHTPFIHLDVGSVRSWPRLTRDQLASIFPDGKTVHIPTDGKPLAGYDLARAEILSRGGAVAGYASADLDEGAIMQGSRRSLWATLFGWDEEEQEARPQRGRAGTRRGTATPPPSTLAYAPATGRDDAGANSFFSNPTPGVSTIASTTSAPQRQPARPAPAPVQVAAAPPEPAQPRLVSIPLPVARPTDLRPVEVAAVQPDAAGQRLAWQTGPQGQVQGQAAAPVPAPLPPIRPATPTLEALVAQVAADPGAANAGAAAARDPAPRLVAVNHPAPPGRPRQASDPASLLATLPAPAAQASAAPTQVALAAPPQTTASVRPAARVPEQLSSLLPVTQQAPAARGPTARDRAALDMLFAAASVGGVMPGESGVRITTTSPKIVAPRAGQIAVNAPAAASGFSRQNPLDVRSDRFSGPAVKPLPAMFVRR